MVSLRERKARVSYSKLPEGFEESSEEDEDDEGDGDGSGDEEEEGNDGTTSNAGINAPSKSAIGDSSAQPAVRQPMIISSDAESDEEMSSGNESEFEPERGTGKGKGKGKSKARGSGVGQGKGKSKKRTGQQEDSSDDDSEDDFRPDGEAEEDESLDLDMDAVEEDGDDDVGDGDDDIDEDDDGMGQVGASRTAAHPQIQSQSKSTKSSSTQTKKSKSKSKAGASANNQLFSTGIAIHTSDRSDLHDIPGAYRGLMEMTAERMLRVGGPGVGGGGGGGEDGEDIKPGKGAGAGGKKPDKGGHANQTALTRLYSTVMGLPWSSHLIPATNVLGRDIDKGKGKAKTTAVDAVEELIRYRIGDTRSEKQRRAERVDQICALGIARGAWEGEAWWPEMYDAAADPNRVDVQRGVEQEQEQEQLHPPAGRTDMDVEDEDENDEVPQPKRKLGRPRKPRPGEGEDEEEDDNTEDNRPLPSGRMMNGEQRGISESLPPGWTERANVRIGLDSIGRHRMSDLEILSEADAEPYLPTVIDQLGNPCFTVHLGPYGKQEEVEMSLFSSVRNEKYSLMSNGATFCAGGPVWGLDWCPLPEEQITKHGNRHFLSVSTLPHVDTAPALGEKWPRDTPGCVQIWSIPGRSFVRHDRGGDAANDVEMDNGQDTAGADSTAISAKREAEGARCEMVLCTQGGPVMVCKWMPMGAWDDVKATSVGSAGLPKLGILATVQLDGSVSIYSVARAGTIRSTTNASTSTDPLFVKMHKPILKFEIPDTAATCAEWLTGRKLLVGYSNGHLAVWNVYALLTDPTLLSLPDLYIPVADASLTSLAVSRTPPKDGDDKQIYDADPMYVACVGYDTATKIVDLRDVSHVVEIHRTRIAPLVVAWTQQHCAPVHADIDYLVNMYKIRNGPVHKAISVSSHRGPVWDIATSDYHTMVVSGSADGSAILASFKVGYNRPRRSFLSFQRLFELDYDKHTGHYRITDGFSPETLGFDLAASRQVNHTKQNNKTDVNVVKTANWDSHVAIHRAAWQCGSGIRYAGLVAMGTASGLVRVEDVRPDWGTKLGAKGML